MVNYWSSKAGPCLKLWPVLEKLANEYTGKYLLINFNTDKYLGFSSDSKRAQVLIIRVAAVSEGFQISLASSTEPTHKTKSSNPNQASLTDTCFLRSK